MNYQIIDGESSAVLKTFPDNHFDSIVTDPPYGIEFLGKAWDEHTGTAELYKECLRVLKPGGHLLAFSAARTYHKLATTIENAGFEIRDQVMWLYSSGFPKSQDVGRSIDRSANRLVEVGTGKTRVSGGAREFPDGPLPRTEETIHIPQTEAAKEWSGWGTQLKPAHEPICMARKPLKQTVAKNCQEWGTGAINIDAGRIPFTHGEDPNAIFAGGGTDWSKSISQEETDERATLPDRKAYSSDKGRFPSNVIGEIQEPYQKYFYQPKVSRAERHCGFDTKDIAVYDRREDDLDSAGFQGLSQLEDRKSNTDSGGRQQGNNHPTVKPVALMDYLIKLVTKPGGKVLDPFNGSGSTGMAAVKAGYEYVGIDLDPAYIEISRKRIDAWCKEDNNYSNLFGDDDE